MAAPRPGWCRAVLLRLVGVIACALGLAAGVVPAQAQPAPLGVVARSRRPVAVIDLARERGARALTQELIRLLRDELDTHPELRTLLNSSDAAALVDAVDDTDRPRLERANEERRRADEALRQFDSASALRSARDGQAELLVVTPASATRPYAELAFLAGVAHVNEALEASGGAARRAARMADAKATFALCHRLDPSRAIDPAKYVPEVVTAYAEARAATQAGEPGQLEIRGTGHVWIDGVELGFAPGTFAVGEGIHVVWLTGVERETRGATVVVAAGQPAVVEIADIEVSRRAKVQRARQQLAEAPDPTAKAAAMKRLADLIGVQDAVLLLSAVDTKIVWQTWRDGNVDRAPGFSALRERTTEPASDLLIPLAPPRKEVPELPPIKQPPIVVVQKRWYERRPVQAGLIVGIAAAIVGGVLWATADRYVTFDEGIFFPPPTAGRR